MKIVPALITAPSLTSNTNVGATTTSSSTNSVSSSIAFVRQSPSSASFILSSPSGQVSKTNLTAMRATSTNKSGDMYGCESGCQCNKCQPISSSNCICSGECGGVRNTKINDVYDIRQREVMSRMPLGKCDCSCSKCVTYGLLMNTIV